MNPLGFAVWPFSTAYRWIKKVLAMLREVRTHEQHMLGARDLIASELRHNASVVAERKSPLDWKRLRAEVSLGRWEQYGGELSILRKRHPDVWEDLVSAYETLRRSVHGHAPGITSEDLTALADRLRQAKP